MLTSRNVLFLSILTLLSGKAIAGDIAGRLTAADTQNPMVGVRITLSGTEHSAVTNSDGRFFMSDIRQGQYTIRANGRNLRTVNVAATGVTELILQSHTQVLETVNVVARTRADANAMENASDRIVNVLSEDYLQTTAVRNVAEALGLMPGVNVFSHGQSYLGGIDGASRGEGRFASIRGLNSEYNVNMVNGMTVANGQPYSRGVDLALLPPSGLHTIELNKTSTPDMDGDAIGGTLDYRTPSAFNFNRRSGGSITLGGRLETQAREYGKNGLGGIFAAEYYTRAGQDDRIGIYANVYANSREFVNSQLWGTTESALVYRQVVPVLDANGVRTGWAVPPGVDPQDNLLRTRMSVAASSGTTERRGGSLTLDWRLSDTTHAWLRTSYGRADTEHESTIVQLYAQDITYAPEAAGSNIHRPVMGRIPYRFWYQTNPEVAELSTFQIGFDRTGENWRISPSLYYGEGRNDRPYHIEISASLDNNNRDPDFQARRNSTIVNSPVFSVPGKDGFPIPQVNDTVAGWLRDGIGGLHGNRWGDRSGEWSMQRKWGGRVDFTTFFDGGALEYIQFGFKHMTSDRNYRFQKFTTANVQPGEAYLRDMGILDGSYRTAFPGVYDWNMPRIDREALKRQINSKPVASWSCGPLQENYSRCNAFGASETVNAAYVMGKFNFGATEVIPGYRIEHTSIRNNSWTTDAAFAQPGAWRHNNTYYTEFLPSVHVNYRPDDNLVVRGALWTSYTRPPFVQLGGRRQIRISQDNPDEMLIREGNPNLKPIRAINFDAAVQWDRPETGTNLLGAVFYKSLSDYIYEYGTSTPYPQQQTGLVRTLRPVNGGSGRVYGLELAARQSLTMFEGPISGLGAGMNLTMQRSEVDLNLPGFHKVPIQNAPELLGNAELFYRYGGFSASLSFNHSGAHIASYGRFGAPTYNGERWDNVWVASSKRFDLHVGYAPNDWLHFDLSGTNLTNEHSYRAHVGKNSKELLDVVDNGQNWVFTTRISF